MFASKIARSATLSLAVAAVISSIAVPATAGVTIFGGSEDKQQVQLPDFVKLVEDNGPGVVNIQMIRNARKEQTEQKPLKAYRELFQFLKSLYPEPPLVNYKQEPEDDQQA